jgi:hypothetical protein
VNSSSTELENLGSLLLEKELRNYHDSCQFHEYALASADSAQAESDPSHGRRLGVNFGISLTLDGRRPRQSQPAAASCTAQAVGPWQQLEVDR